jgi:hypothetical protein
MFLTKFNADKTEKIGYALKTDKTGRLVLMCRKKQLQEQGTPILLNNYSLHFRSEQTIKLFKIRVIN